VWFEGPRTERHQPRSVTTGDDRGCEREGGEARGHAQTPARRIPSHIGTLAPASHGNQKRFRAAAYRNRVVPDPRPWDPPTPPYRVQPRATPAQPRTWAVFAASTPPRRSEPVLNQPVLNQPVLNEPVLWPKTAPQRRRRFSSRDLERRSRANATRAREAFALRRATTEDE